MSLPLRDYDNTLKHHGVMGMRWGVHKAEPSSSVPTRRPSHPDHYNDTPHPRVLSDIELKRRVQRLQMERQYIQLVTGDSVSTVAKGETATKDMLAKMQMANQAYNLITSPMAKAVGKHLSTIAKGAFQVGAYKIGLPVG